MKSALLALLLVTACKHGTGIELDVRNATSTTRSRAVMGTSDINVPELCHGGYLEQRGADGMNLIETVICPTSASEGWRGWHADLYVYGDAAVTGSVPPKIDFGVRPGQAGGIEVVARNFRGKVALPQGVRGEVMRDLPELLGFALVTGVVPLATDGQYEVVEH